MGLKNEDCSALLKIDGGGEAASLWFTRVVPGMTVSVLQTHGQARLYDKATLGVSSGYRQEDGTLSVMGKAMGETRANLHGGGVVDFVGGSVILGDGSIHHQSVLESDVHIKFGAASTLVLGYHPFGAADLVVASKVTISTGAQVEFVAYASAGGSDYFVFDFLVVNGDDEEITGEFTLLGSGSIETFSPTHYRHTSGPYA